MSNKLKVLGLGLAATLMVSAFAVTNAGATTGGHLTWDGNSDVILLKGTQEGTGNVFKYGELTLECAEGNVTAESSSATTTVTSVTAFATFGPTGACTGAFGSKGHVTMNGCDFELTIGKYAHEDNTTHLKCTGANVVEVHIDIPILADCTLTMSPQTPQGGIAYTTGNKVGEKHDITADITATGITVTRHGNAICGAAEAATGSLIAKVTVQGFEPNGTPINITATGSSGTKEGEP